MAMTDAQVKILRKLYDAMLDAENEMNLQNQDLLWVICQDTDLAHANVLEFKSTLAELVDAFPTYKVIKMYRDADEPVEIMFSGLEKEEAMQHCKGPDSSGDDWFYGFRVE